MFSLIRVIKNNLTKVECGMPKCYFEFEYENDYLPLKTYQLGLVTYMIENGSIATDTINKKSYIYKDGKWVKIAYKEPSDTSTITENGNYTISNNEFGGINIVSVDVKDIPSVLGDKTITENGTYNASDDNVEGYSTVTVDVPSQEPTLKSKNITANGTYNASSDNVDGYNSVKVSVTPKLKYKVINDNSTYIASSENVDGYSTVNVYVPPYINSIRTIYSIGDDYGALTVVDAKNGEYVVDEPIISKSYYAIVFISPVKSITFDFEISAWSSIEFVFRPAEGETVEFFDVSGNTISYSGEIANSGNYVHVGHYNLNDGLSVWHDSNEFPLEIQ